MTNATLTPVTLVSSFTGKGDNPESIFKPDTSNRLYRTADGQLVITSWAAADGDYAAHAMGWPARDDGGYPTNLYMLKQMIAGDESFYVDGPDTDETHNAALAQQGYAVESQEAAA